MASCKICGRKESKKRVLDEQKICSVCSRKLKENNYELVEANKDIINSTVIDVSNQNDSQDSISHEVGIRELIKETMIEEIKRFDNVLRHLEQQVNHLQTHIEHKNVIIEELVDVIRNTNKNTLSQHITNGIPDKYEQPFQTVNSKRVSKLRDAARNTEEFVHENCYQPLYHPTDSVCEEDEFIYADDANIMTGSTRRIGKTNGINAGGQTKRPHIVTKDNPENEYPFKKTLPGNTNYADVTKQGRKKCIIGGSIVKRIDMREFNVWLENGTAIKRCFPGAVASQLGYYVEEVLNEENIDEMIINVGTNNLSKKRQTEEDTVQEIIGIVKKCHAYGVNNVYVSGITCRPEYQWKVDKINKLLRDYAGFYNYKFIDNTNIEKQHLWKDSLHLNDNGTINLACSFLDCLNKRTYEFFY